MRITIVCLAFSHNYFARRWELFAEAYPDMDVTLLAPAQHSFYQKKNYSYGKTLSATGHEIDKGNFHIRLFSKKQKGFIWWSEDFKRLLDESKPDIIYHIGLHTQYSLVQLLRIRKKYHPKAKVMAFSMRGPNHDIAFLKELNKKHWSVKGTLKQLYTKLVVNYVNKRVDAFLCHYPDALDSFKRDGYNGPIYMQTQVGVNGEWFYQDEEARKEMRSQLGLGDSYVFASAARFTSDKGIDDVLNALPEKGNWKYVLMGAGSEEETNHIKSVIESRGIQDKVILTGFIDWLNMPKYWNAVDCAVHVPKTTDAWVETFSLTVVQAMITGLPLIADDSGSVPYQAGNDAIVVPEGDVNAISRALQDMIDHPEKGREIGAKLKKRAEKCFEVKHLNACIHDIFIDVSKDIYDKDKIDMASYLVGKE